MRTIISINRATGRPGSYDHEADFDYIEMKKTVIDGREIYIMKNEVRGNHEEKTFS